MVQHKRIAIIGATGMLGQPVTKEFITSGFEVTILARDNKKANSIFGNSVKVISGNLNDKDSIKLLLEGQEFIYLNLSVLPSSKKTDFQPEREGINNVLEVVKECNIKRIGYLSSLVQFYQGQNGFNWWVFDLKLKAVEKIKNIGIPYSIFYPSTFMENFDKGNYRQGNYIALAGTSKHKMYLISGSDYAKQVVKSYLTNSESKDYVIQGQEGFTADEAVKFFINNLKNQKLKVVKSPLLVLRLLGLFLNKFSYAANIIEALNNYPEKFEAKETWDRLGEPKTKFCDYIKQINQSKARTAGF